MPELSEGWGFPTDAGRAHFFVDGQSLCRKWLYRGRLEADDGKARGFDCKPCHQALAKRRPGDAPAKAGEDSLNLGPCCACRGTELVHAIVILPHKSALPTRGWGCFVCDLPYDGASAVLCESCAAGYQAGAVQLVDACRGWAGEDGREPIASTRGRPAHGHDLSKHPEAVH